MNTKALNSVTIMQNALKKFNKELESKIDVLEIDTEKAFQSYYIHLGADKYSLGINKVHGGYKWSISIEDSADIYYVASMCLDVHTGKAKVLKTYVNKLYNLVLK